MINTISIFDFNTKSDISNWSITDDVVMGGQSSGSFYLDNDGFGVFEGLVSIENNGGFSSVRYGGSKIQLTDQNNLRIHLKGDGKRYQFRIKADTSDYYSFIYTFKTTGAWEIIEIPLKDFYPSFRGQKLNFPNFSSKNIEEIGFLIGNKVNENFKLVIDKIELF
jgi:hypothetical protein